MKTLLTNLWRRLKRFCYDDDQLHRDFIRQQQKWREE